MPKPKAEKSRKKRKVIVKSPRIAHVDFNVEKERHFIKYVKYLSSPWTIMWRNFLSGTFQGLGLVLGTAIFLALIGFIVSKVLINIPLFQDFSEALNIWLENTLSTQQ